MHLRLERKRRTRLTLRKMREAAPGFWSETERPQGMSALLDPQRLSADGQVNFFDGRCDLLIHEAGPVSKFPRQPVVRHDGGSDFISNKDQIAMDRTSCGSQRTHLCGHGTW